MKEQDSIARLAEEGAKMRKSLYLVMAMLLACAAHANGLPPIQYVDGAPACPRDIDIQNIETRLSARVIPAENRAALEHEKAKAILCRTAGSRYSPADWKRMYAVTRGDN